MIMTTKYDWFYEYISFWIQNFFNTAEVGGLGLECRGNGVPQLGTHESSSSYFGIEIVLTKFCSVAADT